MKSTGKAMVGLTACCTLLCAAAGLTACHTHGWNEGEVTTAATCGEAGVKTYTCECGETRTEEIPALGHSWDGGEVTDAPTCTDGGEKTYTCTRDGCTQTKTEAVSKTGHSFGTWAVTPPQDGAEGKAVQNCTHAGCTEKNEETLPVLTDNGYTLEDDTATCGHAGTATYKITVNGTPFEFTAESPQKAHTEEWVVTKDPSFALPGTAAKFCAHCDYDFETAEELPVLTSDNAGSGGFYTSVTQKPTCTENGKITYTVSPEKAQELFGGATLKAFEVTDGNDLQATGHDYAMTKSGNQAVMRCQNSGCRDTQVVTWEKDMPAAGTSSSSPTALVRGKYNFVTTASASYYYSFNVTQAGLYKIVFTYFESPEFANGVAPFVVAACRVNNDDGTSKLVVNRNAVYAAYSDIIVMTYEEVDGFAANRCMPTSLVMNFTAEDVGKKVVLQLQSNTADKVDCVIDVDIPEDNTPAPLPKLEFGANNYTFTANEITNFEFTSAAAKSYSVSASDGVTVGLERADGTYTDLILNDGETVNFDMSAGETVTISAISSASGQKTVTIGEAVEEVESGYEISLANDAGNPLTVSVIAKSVVAVKVSDELTAGKYTIKFSGTFVTSRAIDRGNLYFKLNGDSDYASATNNDNALLMQSYLAKSLNGWEFNRANGWEMTLDLAPADVIYLAPPAGSMPEGSVIDVLNMVLTKVD